MISASHLPFYRERGLALWSSWACTTALRIVEASSQDIAHKDCQAKALHGQIGDFQDDFKDRKDCSDTFRLTGCNAWYYHNPSHESAQYNPNHMQSFNARIEDADFFKHKGSPPPSLPAHGARP